MVSMLCGQGNALTQERRSHDQHYVGRAFGSNAIFGFASGWNDHYVHDTTASGRETLRGLTVPEKPLTEFADLETSNSATVFELRGQLNMASQYMVGSTPVL